MAYNLGLLVVGALLAGPPESGDTGPATQTVTEAEALSALAGNVLGAASACQEIGRERLSSVAQKLSAMIAAAVTDDDELTGAQQLFDDNSEAGKAAVRSGKTDCRTVDDSLAALEAMEVPQEDD